MGYFAHVIMWVLLFSDGRHLTKATKSNLHSQIMAGIIYSLLYFCNTRPAGWSRMVEEEPPQTNGIDLKGLAEDDEGEVLQNDKAAVAVKQ